MISLVSLYHMPDLSFSRIPCCSILLWLRKFSYPSEAPLHESSNSSGTDTGETPDLPGYLSQLTAPIKNVPPFNIFCLQSLLVFIKKKKAWGRRSLRLSCRVTSKDLARSADDTLNNSCIIASSWHLTLRWEHRYCECVFHTFDDKAEGPVYIIWTFIS